MRLERPRPLARRPHVSVVVPCYNYGRYLPDAVRSATVAQPGVDVEVIVVDDASPDGSGVVAHELASRDPRVRVIAHEKNAGHLRTYNDGLRAAAGEYVVLLSADDQLAPGALGRSAALLDARPNVGFVYGYPQEFSGPAPTVEDRRVRSWGVWSGEDWYTTRARHTRNLIFSPEVVMRRELLGRLDFYDLGLPHTADMYLWLRAAQVADVGRVNGPSQAFYRVHGSNMHLTQYAGILVDLRERAATWDRLVDNDPLRRTELRLHARAAIAREALAFAAHELDSGRAAQAPVAELAELAREIWPAIIDSPRWTLLDARRRSGLVAQGLRGARVPRTVSRKVAWRRWRRYGCW